MRISTSQIYGAGLRNIQRNQEQLVKLQNQISSDRRMLTPADDPVAAARALTITQAKELTTQYAANQAEASGRLGLIDSQLTSVNDLLASARDRVIQAGNTILSDSDRQAIATELSARFDELLGIANSRNAQGDYLFAGYQSETAPFARTAAVPPATSTSVAYAGDDGQQLLQVAASQQMATNVAGSELFMNIPEGNGSFAVSAGRAGTGATNLGSGVVDSSSLLDPAMWRSAVNGFAWQGASSRALQLQFSTVAGVSQYQWFDISTAAPPAAALPPVAVSAPQPFTPGMAIRVATTAPPAAVATDFGAQVVVSGAPADGDAFTVRPSTQKSVFQTMQEIIDLLNAPLASSSGRIEFSGELAAHLTNLDRAIANVSRVQSSVGARMQELDALSSNSSAVDIQYQQMLSGLQDLDYAQAITDFTRQQVVLEAAQKSFVSISDLSLFKYI
ncbi:flagellar hook-associated protein FlgL [Accumulibacter sp.]|uniref:flagellar hook-associated protein FlgL n=1 Tax=Accumulibacter sp. TaxID=2053492 RepID=UPI00263254A2|nr:flagellar hook-associated protein FlgL [Accumulibacter sp.]